MTAASGGLRHDALLYDSDDRYLGGLLPFITGGLGAGEPVFVAVPAPRVELLRGQLNGHATDVRFADMTSLGANPHRIIPAIRDFVDAHDGQQVRFVGEPIWHGRGPAELAEATRHEALINLAFAGTAAHIVCPYDTAVLDAAVLADAERTHPDIVEPTGRRRSMHYADPVEFCRAEFWPLSVEPADCTVIEYHDATDLRTVRRAVRAVSRAVGLDQHRTDDSVLAVNELCANSLDHAGGSGRLRVWDEPAALICQTTDAGAIADPLAGRHRASEQQIGGRGLYLVNHLADVTQIRSTTSGTTIRLTFYI
jgi:anti-sigma regulatory factor (Ser/Thr protein kinase)